MFLNYNELGQFSLYFDMNKSERKEKQKKKKKKKNQNPSDFILYT